MQALCNTYTLQSLMIECNSCTEEAADDISIILSHNTKLILIEIIFKQEVSK